MIIPDVETIDVGESYIYWLAQGCYYIDWLHKKYPGKFDFIQ